jgi:LSD1 subclass zinc finger protein
VCATCKRLAVVDLSAKQDMHRCKDCQNQLTLLEGMAHDIPCPACNTVLRSTHLGVWADPPRGQELN